MRPDSESREARKSDNDNRLVVDVESVGGGDVSTTVLTGVRVGPSNFFLVVEICVESCGRRKAA